MFDSGSCSPSETRRITELLGALRTTVVTTIDSASPLMSAEFVEEFQSRLLAQHVFLGNPLFQDSFERAFTASAEAAGFHVEQAAPGQRFWDLKIDRRPLSLKSSKALSMKRGALHVSKLTEAAWIQDCRTAARRHAETLALFDSFCGQVDEIIQVRYFESAQLYEIVGIPVALLRLIADLPVSEFQADGPSIRIPVGKVPPDFTLKLDRSDAKVTLTNIRIDKCLVHATWRLGA